ncbi:MAG: 2-amino-4-hydroxy-6-hydroxymethyldihydropteridine diphosphokinase, partial [Candidatus Heimdallarchaeota archaeon]
MSENVNKDNKPLFITLGSNINPRQNLDNAINYLKDEFENIKVSNYYLTPAITGPKSTSKQEDYLNAAILTVSNLDANFIKFNILRKIEQRLGRVRTSEKFAARTMDLDIALYGPLVTHIDNIVIPDPDILRYA